MLKRDERTDPLSNWNRAGEDEYVFVLLGRDRATPAALRAWVAERVQSRVDPPDNARIAEALDAAERLDAYVPPAPPPAE